MGLLDGAMADEPPKDEDAEMSCGCLILVLAFYGFAVVGVVGLLLIGWRAIFG